MISYEDVAISQSLSEAMQQYIADVNSFREEGPLSKVSLIKLEEHFRASHIYHSAGIEGNQLTLRETALILQEGLDIRGRPLDDVVEVKNLGLAFDFLKNLSEEMSPIREVDIRSMHSILVGDDPDVSPGAYRTVGVVIAGAEHKPPEPLEVTPRMADLVEWLNQNINQNPIVVAAIAHHELAAIHPFVDGNGRAARLLMNLILLKRGFPICNIARNDRPKYFDALAYADIGFYEDIAELVLNRSQDLFSEYVRIRTESKRMSEWAEKWGTDASQVLIRRETREMELWQSRIRQVILEFQNAAELLNDKLGDILRVEFYDYRNAIDFEKYQKLLEDGFIPQANAFSISFHDKRNDVYERFMFRYYRNFDHFLPNEGVIPLELNYRGSDSKYQRLSNQPWASRIRIRAVVFSDEGRFVVLQYDIDKGKEIKVTDLSIPEAIRSFFDDVLGNVFQLD